MGPGTQFELTHQSPQFARDLVEELKLQNAFPLMNRFRLWSKFHVKAHDGVPAQVTVKGNPNVAILPIESAPLITDDANRG